MKWNLAIAAFCAAPTLCAQSQPEPNALPLMPWPASVIVQSGSVPIDGSFSISLSGAGSTDPRIKAAVERIPIRLTRQTGIPITLRMIPGGQSATLNIIVESKDHKAPQRLGDNERYSLQSSNRGVKLSADAPLGALRGIETFLQLVGQNTTGSPGFSVGAVTIQDSPRFPWRGLSLDVSRHFIPLENVKRTLDGMAAVKLNVFHWHLSDDQGFRIESKKFPKLQGNGSDGMFYTQAEVRDLLAYARDRGIRVVPEFDMPGHAASWLPGYPQLASGPGPHEILRTPGVLTALIDPTKESTYKFMDGFIGEMAKLFPDEYFHIGGDEVDPKEWRASRTIQAFMKKKGIADTKALQVYFNSRLLKIVTKHGKRMEGWDEVLQPNLPKNIVIQSWRGQESLWQAAREGYKGILSAGYYLDLMQPASQHYAIDPLVLPPARKAQLEKQNKPVPQELNAEEQKNILGGEAAMWEELAIAENLDAKLWPRLAAIAERFWSVQSVTDVNSMYARLRTTNYWLEWLGLTQRSNLELMRQRLAGSAPVGALDLFASVLEPVKGYSRHPEKYSSTTPLNRLVDSIPPESDAAREFNEEVLNFLHSTSNGPDALIQKLTMWQENANAILPMLKNNSLLTENVPVAEAMIQLCEIGKEAIASRTGKGALRPEASAIVAKLSERQGDLLIKIAPGIQNLVEPGL
ncbi:MAG: family 20 glycosylhydrolase [Acidobacteriaceae bacterium]|nr:family 20 glycosylhydrolase [Acidobacteriaceae bacterium]